MDSTDLAILRELFTDRVFRLGGADPRISQSQIATRLGLPKSTVTQRMRAWTGLGMINGFVLFPAPQLLGRRLFGHIVTADSLAARGAAAQALRDLPGAAFVYEYETAEGFWAGYLGPGPEVARSASASLGRLPGIRVAPEVHEFPMPPVTLKPSPLDWQIIRAVRSAPGRSTGKIAGALGISTRTLGRRLDRLLSSLALLCAPRLDFTRAVGTIVETELHLEAGADVDEVWSCVDRAIPVAFRHYPWNHPTGVWPTALGQSSPATQSWGPCLQYFSCLKSPGEAVSNRREAERWPGVRRVATGFVVGLWDIPDTFDRLIGARNGDRGQPRSA